MKLWPIHKPKKDQALMRTGVGGFALSVEKPLLAFPLLHKLSILDLSIKTISILRDRSNPLITLDHHKVIGEFSFDFQLIKQKNILYRLAATIGPENTFNPHYWIEIFSPKFHETLEMIAVKSEVKELMDLDSLKNKITGYITEQGDGMVLTKINFRPLNK